MLINASRCAVVDEKALLKALHEKLIFGTFLDVYENEPLLEPGLSELDKVFLAPHIASATPETQINMGQIVIANIQKLLEWLPTNTCVNPGGGRNE